jgi:NADH:ubiquinone oxidoreductase subunit E
MSAGLAAVTKIRLHRSLGDTDDQRTTAGRVALASGAVVVACTLFLIGDYAVGVWQGAGATVRIEELEGQTKGDPEVATRLHEERKEHTDASLAREARGYALAWVLLFAGGTFVAAGKWWVSLQPERRPSLEALVAVRFGGVGGQRRGAGAKAAASRKPRGEGERESTERPRGERRGKSEGRGSTEQARGGGQGYVAPEAIGQQTSDTQNGRFGRCENVAPEAADLSFIDEVVARFGRGQEHAIPILQAIQGHYRYLPDEALRRVCELTEITPAQIAGTSSFYAQFRRSPVGRHVVRVCHGTACHVAGAEQITDELRRHLDIPPDGDTDRERLFTLDKVACLGCCSLAPVMMIGEETAGRLTPATARQALDAVEKEP